ncbi:hypothetical protein AgCh_014032 [Apium graveolens]
MLNIKHFTSSILYIEVQGLNIISPAMVLRSEVTEPACEENPLEKTKTDIDEDVVGQFKEYDGMKLVFAINEGLKYDDETKEEKENKEEKKKSFENQGKTNKDVLGDKIEKVVVSDMIVESPYCLVMGKYGWRTNMERVMKAQALSNSIMSIYMSSKKTVLTLFLVIRLVGRN